MFGILAGMALGWVAFTDEGRRFADSMVKRAATEVQKTLKETGILEDGVQKESDVSKQ